MRKNKRWLWILVLGSSVLATATVWSRGRTPFPHPKHADVDCSVCHPAAAESENLKTSLLPANTSVCSAECHEPSELSKLGWSTIAQRTSGFRAFSHKAHLGLGTGCQDCHGFLVHPDSVAQGRVVNGHPFCRRCHDGVKQSNECDYCHSNLREDRLSDFQRDPSNFKPMDHHPGFIHDHQFQVRLSGKVCRDCHRQEDFCSECHQGTNVEFLVHDRNFLFTHAEAARKNLVDCQACHEVGTFCDDCHRQQGIEPTDHHQPAWVAGGLHAQAARRDMQLCASCHEEDRACASCHSDPDGVLGTQADRNPHPSGFRDDAGHGYWHDDENAACFACHRRPVPATPGSGFCGYCHGSK
jgi:hypothetical protein